MSVNGFTFMEPKLKLIFLESCINISFNQVLVAKNTWQATVQIEENKPSS